jgi:NAD(P)-dependent dehydrogenase (short-subunit alcohol dehydrogenase family)
MRPFKDLVVLVTGGYQGIGREVAERFVHKEAKVAIFDKEEVNLPKVLAGVGDIQDEGAVSKFLLEVERKLGRVNILVNNVGLGVAKRFYETTKEDFDKIFGVNLSGPFFLTQKVAGKMEEGDSILFITSIHATNPSGDPTYDGSKAAINNLVLNLSLELAPQGVRVNAVAPGHIDTQKWEPRLQDDVPLGKRAGLPEDIAKAVIFLSHPDKARYITGAILPVTGGLHIPKP